VSGLVDVTNAELARALVRIESKLDKMSEDHEARIRRLEKFVYVGLGLGSAGATSGLASLAALIGGGP